jgi:anaerobic selenocysteine-containing dehydrogenase
VDQLTGAARDHVFINVEDARALGLGNDDPVRLESVHGEYRGRAFIADVARGTLQGHWPEVNVLLPPDRVDTFGGVPDYNARVRVHPETVAAR